LQLYLSKGTNQRELALLHKEYISNNSMYNSVCTCNNACDNNGKRKLN